MRIRKLVAPAVVAIAALAGLPAAASATTQSVLANGLLHEVYNGRCLDGDVSGGGGNGSRAQLWDCNGLTNQIWYRGSGDSSLRIYPYGGAARCLDADVSSGGGNGSRVQLWDCNGLTNQQWYWDGSALAYVNGYNGRCLDADVSSGGGNGSKMQLWDCNGLTNQQWY